MNEEPVEGNAHVPWPPFSPDLTLIIDFEKRRPKKERDAILRAAARRRDGDLEPAPKDPT